MHSCYHIAFTTPSLLPPCHCSHCLPSCYQQALSTLTAGLGQSAYATAYLKEGEGVLCCYSDGAIEHHLCCVHAWAAVCGFIAVAVALTQWCTKHPRCVMQASCSTLIGHPRGGGPGGEGVVLVSECPASSACSMYLGNVLGIPSSHLQSTVMLRL